MKIIQIMDNFSVGGGVNSFVFDLCRALKKQGGDVSLIGLLNKGYEKNPEVQQLRAEGIEVVCLGASSKKQALLHDIGKLRTIIKDMTQNEPAVCNLHLKLSVLMGVVSTLGLHNIIRVETYHSLYSKYLVQMKALSPFISMYICCSKSAKEEFVKRFCPRPDKVIEIPNGVNCADLKKLVDEKQDKAMITAVSVGRFTYQKNFGVTASAFSKIENGNFLYKIFGDGELKQQIADSVRDTNKVKLCGQVPRQTIINELANCDIVVMPSLWEGLSIVMLEAMALGRPLMISDVPSLRNVLGEEPLRDGELWRQCTWGYLVETDNAMAYNAAMNHFLENQNLVEEMSKEIEKYSMLYSIEKTANSYAAVYERCLKQEK